MDDRAVYCGDSIFFGLLLPYDDETVKDKGGGSPAATRQKNRPSVCVAGLGTSTNTTDISSLIKLGYHIGLAFSGSFTFGTAANILDTTISLAKTKKGTDYQYMASTEQLSNPSKSQYTRNCSMLAPFKLTRSANYYQMKIGLISANPTVKYKVTVGYTFS